MNKEKVKLVRFECHHPTDVLKSSHGCKIVTKEFAIELKEAKDARFDLPLEDGCVLSGAGLSIMDLTDGQLDTFDSFWMDSLGRYEALYALVEAYQETK